MLLNSLTQSTLALQACAGHRPRQPRASHRLWTPGLALLLLTLFTFAFSRAARAETITLACNGNIAVNRQWLIDAINTANSTAISDTIVLTTSCAYLFDKPLVGNGIDALPVISSPLTIEGNSAIIGAAANAMSLRVLHTKANLTLHNLRLDGGTLTGANWGGAVLAESGTMLTLQGSQVAYGKAPVGGGIAALGDLMITDGDFGSNEATQKLGGAIYAQGQLTITQSTFRQNSAPQYGGAIALDARGGPARIQDSFFSNNRAGSDGGAINAWAPVEISGSDFYSNSATLLGGRSMARRRSPCAIVRCARM